MFQDLRLYAHEQTHYPDPVEIVDGVDLRLEIDGVEIPADTFGAVLPTLRGYPAEFFVLADDERSESVPLVPFFTASVEVTETAYLVTFDPPIRRGEYAHLERTADSTSEVITLPVGATTGEVSRAETTHLALTRATHSSDDAEGLRIRGHMSVGRVLVTPD